MKRLKTTKIISFMLACVFLLNLNFVGTKASTSIPDTSVVEVFEFDYTFYTSFTGQHEYTTDIKKCLAILLEDGRFFISFDTTNPDLEAATLIDTDVEEIYEFVYNTDYLFYKKNNDDLYAMAINDHMANNFEYLNIGTFGSSIKPDALKGIKVASRIHEMVYYDGVGVLYVVDNSYTLTIIYNDMFDFLKGEGWNLNEADYELDIANVVKVRYDGRTGFALKSNGELWAWGYGYYNEFMNDHYDGIFANSSRTGFDIKNDWTKQVPFLYTVGVVDFDYYLGQLMIRNIGDSFYIAGRSFSNANRYDTYTDQAVRDTYYSVMDSYPTYYDFLAAVYNRNYGYNSYNAGFFRDSSSGGFLSERVIIPGMDNRGIINDYSVFKGSYVINDVGTLLDYVNEGFAPQVVAKDVSWVSRSSIDKFKCSI